MPVENRNQFREVAETLQRSRLRATTELHRRQVGRGGVRQDVRSPESGHRPRAGAMCRQRRRGRRSGRCGCAKSHGAGFSLDTHVAIGSHEAGVAYRRPDRSRVRAACRARIARQREDGCRRQGVRRPDSPRAVLLHERMGDAHRRPHRPCRHRESPRPLPRLHAPRARRSVRPDYALELPAADGCMEARAGACGGLRGRVEAR